MRGDGPGTIALLRALLAQGVAVRLRARGKSMAPAIRTGDTLIVRRPKRDELAVGQIGLFVHEGRLFAHRLVAAHAGRHGEQLLIFAGDRNAYPDPPVPASSLLGEIVLVERRPVPAGQLAAAAGLWAVLLGLLGRALGLAALALVMEMSVAPDHLATADARCHATASLKARATAG